MPMMEEMESWQLDIQSTSDHITLCTGSRYDNVSQGFFRRVNEKDLPPCHVDVRGTYNQHKLICLCGPCDPITNSISESCQKPISSEKTKRKPRFQSKSEEEVLRALSFDGSVI